MEAVKRGDMKTAQRMVDEAAKAAGYNVGPVYHGVRERYRMGTESSPPAILPATKFTKWIASEANFPAFYASRDKAAVERWAKRPSNVMAVYLKAQNTAKEGEIIISSSFLQKEVVDKLKSLGYDSVEGGRDFNAHEIAVFDSSQIKSADPVTYDDKGNVIPLSQRFNNQSEDIRNPRQLMGININDKCQDFTGQILRGEKTIETRKTRSLDPYIGERIGLIRTGIPKQKATLVGYATVGEPVVYDSVAKFRRDYDKHLVAPGSAFDIKDGLKYG